jgi:hypothetical protein
MEMVSQKDIEKMMEYVKQYKGTKYIEIEIRFGKLNRDIFDTNVGKQNFEKVKRRLLKYKGWESVTLSEDEVYYWDGIRCIYKESDGSQIVQRKHKIFKNDFKSFPSDFRIAFSQEIPATQPDEDAKRSVTRKRTSFIRKNLSIDLTEVHGSPEDIDTEETISYQIEMEIIDASKLDNDNDIYNILYKINDLMKILP